MPASRGMMTRAASALLFAATLGFSLAFPGSAAESPGGVEGVFSGERVARLGGALEGFPAGVADVLPPNIPADGDVPVNQESCESFLGSFDPTPPGFCIGIGDPVTGPFCEVGRNCQEQFNGVRKCNNEANLRGGVPSIPDGEGFEEFCGAGCSEGLTALGNVCVYEEGGVVQVVRDAGDLPEGIPAPPADVPVNQESCEAFLGSFDPTPPGFCIGIGDPITGPFCEVGRNCQEQFNGVRKCNLANLRGGVPSIPDGEGFEEFCGAVCLHGKVARGNKCVAPSGSDLPEPPPPPECVGACGNNALLYEAVLVGGNLSVHDENGNEISSGDLVRERTLLTLTAEPNENWYVTGWTGCDRGQTGSAGDGAAVKRCLLYMPGDFHRVSVSFGAASGRVLYERAVSGVAGGNLVVVGQLTAFSGGAVVVNGQLLDVGELLTMEASPEDDYYVGSWGGPCAGIGEVGTAEEADRVKGCVLTVFGGMGRIRANFVSKPRETVDPTNKDASVTIVVVDPGPPVTTVTLTGPTDVIVGRTIIIEANPDDGKCVSEWTGACGGGVGETGCVGESDERKKCVLVVTPGLDLDDINPVYVPSPNLFRVSYRGEGMGTLSAYSERAVPVPGDLVSGGAVMEDARVSFLAVPAAGYYVAGWSGVCAGAPIGDKEAQGPLSGGRTCHWVADRDATGSDEAVARFALAPREPYTGSEIVAALPQNRTATRGAVVGYEGVILTVETRDGSSLDFVPSVSGGLEVNARGVVRSRGAVRGLLTGEFMAVLSRADRAPQEVELDVRISAVRPPLEPEAIVRSEGNDVSGSELGKPFGYGTGGSFSQLSHADDGHFTVDQESGRITGTPPAGTYAVPVAFAHPGFAGVIRLTVEVRIIGVGSGIPDSQLNPGVIYLAYNYASGTEFHRMEPDGADVKIARLFRGDTSNTRSITENGVRANIEDNGKRVVFNLISRAGDTDLRGGDFRFTEESVESGDVLRAEERGSVRAQGLGQTSARHIVTEGLSGARAGDYLLAVALPENRRADEDIPAFTDVTVIAADGATDALGLEGPYGTDLVARTDLTAQGRYVLTMTVQSRDGKFLGDQQFIVTVSVQEQDRVPLSLADAIGAASPVAVYAASDYAGLGYSVSLGANLEFISAPVLVGGANDFSVTEGDRVGGRQVAFSSHLSRALGSESKTARVRVRIRCLAPKRCSPLSLNQLMDIAYRPAPAPDQPVGTIPAGEAIERTALAPPGFEGGVFEELDASAYENPAHAALFTVSSAGVVSGGVQPVGTYKIPVGYSTPGSPATAGSGGFLGTVRLTLTVNVVARDIPLEEGLDPALLRPSVVAVSPDYPGALLTLTLRGSVNVTPSQGVVAGGVFSWEQSDREVVLGFDRPLNASGTRGARITLTETVSQNYRDRDAVVLLTVRGVTVSVPLVGGPGSTLVFPYASSEVADLSRVDGAYAGATFTRLGAASPGLNSGVKRGGVDGRGAGAG